MLAPLNWSDYENKHGKLDVFLGSHPEVSFSLKTVDYVFFFSNLNAGNGNLPNHFIFSCL